MDTWNGQQQSLQWNVHRLMKKFFFSEWLESMRKYTECTFGMMEQRFHILKHIIRLHKISNSEKACTTCCALHNILLFVYSLDKGWDEISQHDSQHKFDIPFPIGRLNRHEENEEIRNGNERETGFFDKYSTNGKRVVRKLPLHVFRERLIHRFDICLKK